jgi:hypothetical protein
VDYAASIRTDLILFSWGFDILFNVLPSPIYVLAITQVLRRWRSIWDLNLILFPNPQLIYLPEINLSTSKFRCFFFTYCQSFPNFCSYQIVISITVSSPETLYFDYTRMPSPIYQHVINRLRVFPSVEVQVYLWTFRCGNIVLLTTRFFYVAQFTILIPLSLLPWCKPSIPIAVMKYEQRKIK